MAVKDVDGDQEVNSRKSRCPVLMVRIRPTPSANRKVKDADKEEYDPEEDEGDDEEDDEDDDEDDDMGPTDGSKSKRKPNVKPRKGQEPSKSGTRPTGGTHEDKAKGKGKRPQPMHDDGGGMRELGDKKSKWRMKCIWPDQPAMLMTAEGTTATPTPPVTPITTRSKTTGKGKSHRHSKGKGKSLISGMDAQRPSPIPEEPDADVEMLDDAPAAPSTGPTGPTPDAVPLAAADNFPADHWIEPIDDNLLPPTPFMHTPGDIRYSPIYPGRTQRPPSPVTTSMPLESHQHPRHLTDMEMETMLAQIHFDMEELRTRDDIIHDDLSHCIDQLHANYTEQLGTQRGLVDNLTVQVSGIARYLRENQRTTEATASTPPTFNPPPIVIPGTPIFPEFGSISALGRAVTNHVFTPDAFLTHARPGGDGSPVTRHEQAPTSASTSTITTSASTINPVPTRESGPPTHPVGFYLVGAHPVGAHPVPPPTVPMESMPSTSTLRTLVTGPSNIAQDGQSISAPLPNRSFAPQSHQQGRSVSARHATNPSGDGHK
ncbi:hypothetical protein F4604DRAFT_1692588 [Suillus subluteus]|nr:hypothetical protein F4604DRAFT_1692588 [Suillus subluteus]